MEKFWEVAVAGTAGFIVSFVGVIYFAGAQARTIEIHTEQLSEVKQEQRVLAKDLVETQKDILKHLTRIETKLGD